MHAKLTREQNLDLYYWMRLNRQLEDRLVKLFRQNKLASGVYSSLGPGSSFHRHSLCA